MKAFTEESNPLHIYLYICIITARIKQLLTAPQTTPHIAPTSTFPNMYFLPYPPPSHSNALLVATGGFPRSQRFMLSARSLLLQFMSRKGHITPAALRLASEYSHSRARAFGDGRCNAATHKEIPFSPGFEPPNFAPTETLAYPSYTTATRSVQYTFRFFFVTFRGGEARARGE